MTAVRRAGRPQRGETLARLTPLRADHDFRILFSAYALSCAGDSLALVALTIRAHDLTGSGWGVSAILIGALAPVVLLARVAGRLIDERETVAVVRTVSFIEVGIALALAFATSVVQLVPLTILLAAGFAVTQPGLFALTPEIAGERQLASANGALELARWGGGVVGPLLAGLLAAGGGTRIALVVDAGTFLVMGLAIGALHARRAPASGAADAERPGSAGSGLSIIRRDRALRLVVGVLVTMVLAASMVDVAEVFFVKGVLHAGDAGYGALMAAWGGGVALGVILLARRLENASLVPAVLGAALAVNVAYLIAAGASHLLVAAVAFFAGGVANGLGLVAVRTMLHRRSPDEARGRVFASYGALVTGAQLVAFALGGAVTSIIGARATLTAAAGCGIAVVLVGVVAYGRSAPHRLASAL